MGARKGGGPERVGGQNLEKVEAPKAGGPKGGGRRVGPRRVGARNFALFFSLSRRKISFFSSFSGVFSLNFGGV